MATTSKQRYQDIKDRLAVYRNQKGSQGTKEEKELNTDKPIVDQYLSDPILQTEKVDSSHVTKLDSTKHDSPTNTKNSSPPDHHLQSRDAIEERDEDKSTPTSWLILTLKVLLWCLLQGFFIEIEFGVAFFITSLLYLMYAFMRGGGGGRRRRPWELSAYSVFNRNCERIEGTLGAEQFEQELRYGPTAVHR